MGQFKHLTFAGVARLTGTMTRWRPAVVAAVISTVQGSRLRFELWSTFSGVSHDYWRN